MNDFSFQPAGQNRLRIAVIGTGVAGMSAAWLLSRAHAVSIYEKDCRPGGHSNTLDAGDGDRPVPVDTGFIVYNEKNYPNLVALFAHLGVATKPSEMSFAASLRGGALEYSGTDLNGLFGQRRNLVRPAFWAMLNDLRRFYREAPEMLRSGEAYGLSLGDMLARGGYGKAFVQDHLLPMGAAIWSSSVRDMLAYPAATFIRFFESHGLLNITDRPQWRTVAGGSREYVGRLLADLKPQLRLDCGAARIRRYGDRVEVVDVHGNTDVFDHVVIASHADQALHLLDDADDQERRLLGAFSYSRNEALLHRDARLMPKRRRVWSSWNYLEDMGAAPDRPLAVTYWMNKLQGIDPSSPLFVTLNAGREPEAGSVIARIGYEHPLFDKQALDAQGDLWHLQGRRRTWFCGSYFGYGFHEDALQSGLAVAERLGNVRRPWDVEDESGRIAIKVQGHRAAAQ
jgi:predicted NAD/FAD-binding protein